MYSKTSKNIIRFFQKNNLNYFIQVLVFEPPVIETASLKVHAKIRGSQLGSYFGASLCCLDINNDGRADLLVGAPNFVKKDGELPYDQGAVFVYLAAEEVCMYC